MDREGGEGASPGDACTQTSGILLLCLQKTASVYPQEVTLGAREACRGGAVGRGRSRRGVRAPAEAPHGKHQQEGRGAARGPRSREDGEEPALARQRLIGDSIWARGGGRALTWVACSGASGRVI